MWPVTESMFGETNENPLNRLVCNSSNTLERQCCGELEKMNPRGKLQSMADLDHSMLRLIKIGQHN